MELHRAPQDRVPASKAAVDKPAQRNVAANYPGRIVLAFEPGSMMTHYRLAEKLGEGGMGVVYKALDTKLNRNVALKVLPAHLTADPERRLRFQREAQATAALQHPNIAVIYEVGDDDGTLFIAMEFIEGRSLRATLEDGRLDMREWLRIATALADGVAHAHAHGVVHRDLKPDNVLITADHQIKILDFGLAKLLDPDTLPEGSDHSVHTKMNTMSGELTRAGQVFGTAAYMSPEQARGGNVDRRSDIFSLGVVLYECASGRRPFSGKSHIETLHGVLNEEPAALASVSADLPAEAERVVRKSMEKEPEHRYQHADELATDLRTLQRDLDTGRTTGPRSIPMSVAAPRRPGWLVPGAVVAVAVVLVAAIVWFAGRSRQPSGAASPANARAQPTADAAIAVVGFENLQDAADSDHLGRMLMALVTTDLAESGGLTVVSMPKVLAARQLVAPDVPFTAQVAAETARQADASLMLVGQVGRVGQKLLLTSELIDVASGQTLGSVQKTADTVDDLFAAAGDIGADVRERLGRTQAKGGEAFDLAQSLTTSGEAYRAFAAGEIALHQMNFPDAIAQFDRAVREDSSFAQAYFKRALALDWTGRGDETVASLNAGFKYVDRLPAHWRAVFETYRHYALNEIDQAYEKLVVLLADEPRIPDPYYTLGEILTHESAYLDNHAARRMFEKALEIDPSYRVVLYHLIDTSVSAGDVQSARAVVERMLAIDPDGAAIREAEATVLAAEGHIDDAIALCEQLVARGNDFVMNRLSHLYLANGQLDQALEMANADLERNLKMGVVGEMQGLRMSIRGFMRIGMGAMRAGIEDLRAGAPLIGTGTLTGLGARAYMVQAQMQLLAGEHDAARRALDEAVATDPLALLVRHTQVRLAIEGQQLDQARRVLSDVESMQERFPKAHIPVTVAILRAEIELASGDTRAAERTLGTLQDVPRENLPLGRLADMQARLHLAKGELDAAAREYQRLIHFCTRASLVPPTEWIPAFFELARVEEQLGNTESARSNYERFLSHWGNADLPLASVGEARTRLAALRQTP